MVARILPCLTFDSFGSRVESFQVLTSLSEQVGRSIQYCSSCTRAIQIAEQTVRDVTAMTTPLDIEVIL